MEYDNKRGVSFCSIAPWTGMRTAHQMANKWDPQPAAPHNSGVPRTATQGQTLNPAQGKDLAKEWAGRRQATFCPALLVNREPPATASSWRDRRDAGGAVIGSGVSNSGLFERFAPEKPYYCPRPPPLPQTKFLQVFASFCIEFVR